MRKFNLEDAACMLKSLRQMFYYWDLESDRIFWSENAMEILGVPPNAKLDTGEKFEQAIHRHPMFSRRHLIIDKPGIHLTDYSLIYTFEPVMGQKILIEDKGVLANSNFDGLRPAKEISDHCEPVARAICGTLRVLQDELQPAYRLDCDVLTSVPGRQRFKTLAQRQYYSPHGPKTGALLMILLDGLGIINDIYGHEVGNTVLSQITNRLLGFLQPEELLGRISGNRLGMIVMTHDPSSLSDRAREIIESFLAEPIELEDFLIAPALYVSSVRIPEDSTSINHSLQLAEDALRELRQRGYGHHIAWTPKLSAVSARRNSIFLADEILRALGTGHLYLAHQPIVRADNEKTVFHESLMRLRRDDAPHLKAWDFISVCEVHGIISLIDRQAFRLAMNTLSQHSKSTLSVNISPGGFLDEYWIADALEELHGAPDCAQRLIIEVTESAAIENLDQIRDIFRKFRQTGVKIAIDDLGAGSTSLAVFRNVDLDYVKIDGSFVRRVSTDVVDLAFIRAIVELAHIRGIKTVAEWVEDGKTANLLRDLGVDYFQGFYFGQPDAELT